MEKTKRILIIGGPGSGKTTLIHCIEKQGHTIHHEVSREVTLRAREQGVEQLFLTDPLAFSNELLKRRMEQYEQATDGYNFYDRGIPDVPAYHLYTNDPIPDAYTYAVKHYRYDIVFFLPPWEEIYETDNERYESFEQAVKISSVLLDFYHTYDYTPIEVPKGKVQERYDFIMSHIQGD